MAPSPSSEAPLSFRWNLVAGAIAGITELCLLYPLDVVKTRFQLQVTAGSAVAGASRQPFYTSTADCLRQMVRHEGVRSLYRGILPPIAVETPKVAVKFTANDLYGRKLREWFSLRSGYGPPEALLAMSTGTAAGMTEGLCVVPFDLVKIRLQDPLSRGRYANALDCTFKVLREEGPTAFLAGAESALWRNGVWNGVYFGFVQLFRERWPLPPDASAWQERWGSFLAGLLGGTVATACNIPFDVVKTRIQNQGASIAEGEACLRADVGAPRPVAMCRYSWALPGLAEIWRCEGWRALWKGFVPKVARLGPGGGIMLLVFDGVADFVRASAL